MDGASGRMIDPLLHSQWVKITLGEGAGVAGKSYHRDRPARVAGPLIGAGCCGREAGQGRGIAVGEVDRCSVDGTHCFRSIVGRRPTEGRVRAE